MSIVFRGSTEAMAAWLPFAIGCHIQISRLGIKSQTLTPINGVLIRVQTKPDNIYIEACGGEVSILNPDDRGILTAVVQYEFNDGKSYIPNFQADDHPRNEDEERRAYVPWIAGLPGFDEPNADIFLYKYGLVDISPLWTLDPSYTSIAVQGDRVVTGAQLYTPPDDGAQENETGFEQNPQARTGIAYIHDRITGKLLHTFRRSGDTPYTFGNFGLSVAISDKVAVVGAQPPSRDPRQDLVPGEPESEKVYARIENWLAARRFDPSVFIYDIESGEEIAALDFNTIRLPYGSPPLTGRAGYVPPEGMDTIHPKHIDHHHASWFGEGVAISNSILVIGSPREQLVKYEGPVDVRASVFPLRRFFPLPGSHTALEPYPVDEGFSYAHAWWFGRVYIYSLTDNVLLHELTDPLAEVYEGEIRYRDSVQSPRRELLFPDIEQREEGTSTNGDFRSGFGSCVAISEDLIVVGSVYATYQNPEEYGNRCLAYIYSADSGELLHVLQSPDTASFDVTGLFGFSVDIEVNPRDEVTRKGRVIVGSPAHGGGTSGIEGPAAYIFDAFTGKHLHTLRNPDKTVTIGTSFFGDKVGICEGKAIVAASCTEETFHPGYAFVFSTDTGKLIRTLDSSTFRKPDGHIFIDVDITSDKDTGCSTAATNDVLGDVYLWGM